MNFANLRHGALFLVLVSGAIGAACSSSATKQDGVGASGGDGATTTPDGTAGRANAEGGTADSAVGGASTEPVDGSQPGNQSGDQITVPIELLGEPGLFQTVVVKLSEEPSSDDYLWLSTHRLTWREDGEFATTKSPRNAVHPGTKGSVRVNDGPWVPLSNDSVTCEAHEAEFGCLNGSYQSVRVRVRAATLGAPGLKQGENRIAFRFDETDGITSGWRVLALDVRHATGDSLMTTKLVEDNPDEWLPPLSSAADVAAGRKLWYEKSLTDLGFKNERHAIRAKCGSCHLTDGADLAYFNYSNQSIVARSVFHGFT